MKKHYPVMLSEVIRELQIKSDGVYVDATVGYAGHAKEILKRIKRGHLFAFDQDEEALKSAYETLSKISNRFTLFHTNFENMQSTLQQEGIEQVDGILLDLGFSSPQVDEAERGFSFMKDAELDMRMDKRASLTAKEIINQYSEEQLTHLFYTYGEEKESKKIASYIVKHRPYDTTLTLVDAILKSVGANYFYKEHPERKIFQALRIETNHELQALERVLKEIVALLKPGGVVCIITFHSLEDRMVKQFFKQQSEVDASLKSLPFLPKEYEPVLVLPYKKGIKPTEQEINENRRSKSATLRVAKKRG